MLKTAQPVIGRDHTGIVSLLVQYAFPDVFFYVFIFGSAGLLLKLFSSCRGGGGYSLVVMCRLLIVVAFLVVEHRL